MARQLSQGAPWHMTVQWPGVSAGRHRSLCSDRSCAVVVVKWSSTGGGGEVHDGMPWRCVSPRSPEGAGAHAVRGDEWGYRESPACS